ncbi:MAG: CAP domain-containing protein [Acidimicrobiia bacterium]
MPTRRLRRGRPHGRGKLPSRTRTLLGLFLAVVLALTLTACQDADTQKQEQLLLSSLQRSRQTSGLAPLSQHAGLRDVARRHAEEMARTKSLVHSPNLAGRVGAVVPNWQRVGENVGYGTSMEAVHKNFMASSGHRGNILGRYNIVGIGVSRDETGRYWVVQVFALA